mmetsp:Transcript_767/g.1174  ORF Transcript_767/g.1174 Transcript_767/m.1174 type:complete len:92 (-) Transcript_767:989-1264(-)
MITVILNTRDKILGENHIATGEAHYTLGLLRLLMGREVEHAQANIGAAFKVYTAHLGREHPSTVDVYELLTLLEENQNKKQEANPAAAASS